MNDLNEEDRKWLTEYLGECWHELKETEYGDFECNKCGFEIRKRVFNRVFTTPGDFFALKDKLVKKGEWDKFESYAHREWWRTIKTIVLEPEKSFPNWLINAPRFCWLVNEWLKEKEDEP